MEYRMTVKELKEILSKYDESADVFLGHNDFIGEIYTVVFETKARTKVYRSARCKDLLQDEGCRLILSGMFHKK